MDDRKIRTVLRRAMDDPQAKIGQDVLSEIRRAPIATFEDLPEHEKAIALTAFLAAVSATQSAEERGLSGLSDNDNPYQRPVFGERRTHAGMRAAAAALRRVPEKQRSATLKGILDACDCDPMPELP